MFAQIGRRHVSDLPRFGRRCGPTSCERRAALHRFDSHDGKSLIGVRVDDQAELSGKPEFRQKVRHGLDVPFMGLMPRNSTLVVSSLHYKSGLYRGCRGEKPALTAHEGVYLERSLL